MICQNCGSEQPENVKFCNNCGKSLKVNVEIQNFTDSNYNLQENYNFQKQIVAENMTAMQQNNLSNNVNINIPKKQTKIYSLLSFIFGCICFLGVIIIMTMDTASSNYATINIFTALLLIASIVLNIMGIFKERKFEKSMLLLYLNFGSLIFLIFYYIYKFILTAII